VSVQASPGEALRVEETVRRAWEVDLPDRLHGELVDRIRALHPVLEEQFAVRLEPCDSVAALQYPQGAFYRTHRDAPRRPDRYGLHRRAVSIVIFVNTGGPLPGASFTGGQLWLHDVPDGPGGIHAITPVAGMLVAFRSGVLHEVRPVEAGLRLSIVSWLLASVEPGRGRSGRLPGRQTRR
jgi:predicted 2-oxoglutarate/Fe(II)-dependent dioxygenase YbiX